jgi:hypothetical protein
MWKYVSLNEDTFHSHSDIIQILHKFIMTITLAMINYIQNVESCKKVPFMFLTFDETHTNNGMYKARYTHTHTHTHTHIYIRAHVYM